jgi:glycosyltransferase involved in cell wall biosynthesis
VVWALRAPLAEMALEAGWPASRILVDLVDLESEAVGRALAPLGWYAKRPLHNLDLKRLERYERSLPARFGHVVVCKSDDRTVLGTPPNASVVPNGVNLQPAVDSSHADANEMLFVGSMGYDPNADAVKWFMRDIMPEILRQHPPARLAVVGKEVGADVQRLHDGHSCIIHGAVPEVAPFYAAAGLVVVPIRLGAGTRLKVLEALMLGKPIVATRMAVEGIDITSGEHYEAADSEADFARICVELMRDATRRQRLAEAGRQRVIELYQWSRIGNLAADVADNVGRREAAPVSSVAG